jgi:hypothetical protein
MEFLFVCIVIVGLALIAQYGPKPGTPSRKSDCPPHAWTEIPVKDKAGDIQGYKLICSKCGPMENPRKHEA